MNSPIEFSVGYPNGYGFSIGQSIGVGVADVIVNDESVVDEYKIARFLVPTQLSQLSADTTHRLVSDAEKTSWDGKYSKPSGGIPSSDMSSEVQISLGLADTALQEHQSLSAYRMAATQDEIDEAQDSAIAAKYSKPSGGIPKTDLASGVQTSLNNADATAQVVPSSATSSNKLVTASEMGDAISSVEAKQLYATASQGSFSTKAALTAATTFYNADGTVATPTKNDVAYVLADESHDGKSAKYVIASVDPIVWGFVITFSDTTFTQAQMDAINSGATSAKIGEYDTHVDNGDIHVTTTQKSTWNGKQSQITASGILKGNGSGGVSAAVAGTDYQAPIDTAHKLFSKFVTGASTSDYFEDVTVEAALDSLYSSKENKGKITISGVEKTANTHTVTIVTNGVTTTMTLVGVS